MGYILIAEDDLSSQDVIKIVMKMEGFEHRFVGNGQEALQAVAKEVPSLILLDLQMPVMDGPTFLNLYCKAPDGNYAPIIVVSAHPGRFEDFAPCVVDFLHKPYELSALLGIIKKYMPPQASV